MKSGRRSVYLHQGQILTTRDPILVKLILGSCVAIGLWDAQRQVGGICHYSLPHWVSSSTRSCRFGNIAFEEMLLALEKEGAQTDTLSAKIFGGASIDPGLSQGKKSLGSKNIHLAVELLEAHGFPILERSTGGRQGRRIEFCPLTGQSRVQFL